MRRALRRRASPERPTGSARKRRGKGKLSVLWLDGHLSPVIAVAAKYLDEFAFRCSHRKERAVLVDLVLASCGA